jgi:hypothetical protein
MGKNFLSHKYLENPISFVKKQSKKNRNGGSSSIRGLLIKGILTYLASWAAVKLADYIDRKLDER